MDDPHADFHVPKNKGREAMAYLTYLIDHYRRLPSTIAFIHSHREGYPMAWHTDAEDYSNVNSLRDLQIPYVQEQGYVNLRCNPDPGCPAEIQPFRQPYDGQQDAERAFVESWASLFDNETETPPIVAAACCGQFAVSRNQVLRRSHEDYKRYRDWLLKTSLTDAASGRTFEYLWHVIFGRAPVFCPDLKYCYCKAYGKCGES
jgi:Protein of unknown function (DUF3431)